MGRVPFFFFRVLFQGLGEGERAERRHVTELASSFISLYNVLLTMCVRACVRVYTPIV